MGCLGASPPTPDGVSCPDIVRGPSVDQIKGWKLDGGLYPAGEVVCSDTAGTGRRHAGKSTLLTWTTPAAAALRNRNQRTGLAFTLPLTAPSVQFPDRRRWGAQGDERGRGRTDSKRVVACWALCPLDNITHLVPARIRKKAKGWGLSRRALHSDWGSDTPVAAPQRPVGELGCSGRRGPVSWQPAAADIVLQCPSHYVIIPSLTLFVGTVGISLSSVCVSRGTRGPDATVVYSGAL